MITETTRTGKFRTVERAVPAIQIGLGFGMARTPEEIPAIAGIMGRPAGAHVLLEKQELVVLVHHKALGTEREHRWVTRSQERIPA